METKLSGSPIKAAPAQILVTFGAGQPKFRSITSQLGASICAAVTMSSAFPPKICGINGTSVSCDSILRQETAASLLKAVLLVNSVMVTSAPHCFASNRYGKSVTPDIGARNRGRSSPSHLPNFSPMNWLIGWLVLVIIFQGLAIIIALIHLLASEQHASFFSILGRENLEHFASLAEGLRH